MSNVGAVIAAHRVRQERKLVAQLRDQSALSARAAIRLNPERRLARAALRTLIRHGAVKQTGADLYWLDEPAYDEMRANRKRMVFLALAVGAIVILFVVFVVGPR